MASKAYIELKSLDAVLPEGNEGAAENKITNLTVPVNVPLELKRAYVARYRQANYAASMRLEGVDSCDMQTLSQTMTRDDIIAKYKALT